MYYNDRILSCPFPHREGTMSDRPLPQELHAALERIREGKHDASDLALLRAALTDRSIAIRGDANGAVLVTGDHDESGSGATLITQLEVFSPRESRDFLRRHLPPKRAPDAELDALAEHLGRLPLALELAARYLARHPDLGVDDYLGELEEVLAHPSMRNWRRELGNPTGHDLDLLTTFALSWERYVPQT